MLPTCGSRAMMMAAKLPATPPPMMATRRGLLESVVMYPRIGRELEVYAGGA
jgi:hypothetical protein